MIGFGEDDAMAPAKPSLQVQQTIAAMESMEECLLDAMKAMAAKVDGIDDIAKRLTQINLKLEQLGDRLDQVKTKVDLSMTYLGQVQQEQT